MKGSSKSSNFVSLEEVITKRKVMVPFIVYLVEHYAGENMRFWLEAQIFKYEKDQAKCRVNAEKLYEKYWGPGTKGLNIEEHHLVLELAQKIKKPDRTVFMLVQNAIWGLLKLECYPKFREQSLSGKLKRSKLKSLLKNEQVKELISLYDKFMELNTQWPCLNHESGIFRPTILPNDQYAEHLNATQLPTIEELWKDPDLMLAFREFLYQSCSYENLSFYLEASNYEYLTDQKQIEKRAKEIAQKYICPNAPMALALDWYKIERLLKSLQKPNNLSFKPLTDRIYKELHNEWFPDFIVSPLYHACNDDTIDYVKSGGRNRSRTLDEYDLLRENIGTKPQQRRKTP